MSLRPPDSHGWGRDHLDGEELWNVFAGQHKKQEQYRQALLRNWWECYKVRLECQMDCSGIRWVSTTYKWIFRCMAFLYLYATNGYSVWDFHLAQRQWHWVSQYSLQITIMINATQGNSEHTQSTPRAHSEITQRFLRTHSEKPQGPTHPRTKTTGVYFVSIYLGFTV